MAYSLEELITKVFLKNSILFVGAGFSHSAKNILDENLVIANGLTEKLYTKLGIDSDGLLENAVEEYIDIEGVHSLIDFLKKEFTVKDIQDEHKIILSLPWKRIYTTNYDNVLELAKRENKLLATPVTLQDRPHQYKDKSQLCIHLNGYIERLTSNALQKEFKLRNVSYLSTEFADSEWISLFRNDIKTSDSIFFVGFSLAYDLDLKRIIFDQPETHEKIAFILYEHEKSSSLRNSAKFGVNYTIGVKMFASEIEKIKNNYTPPNTRSLVYESFKKIEFGNSVEPLRDNDAIDLFYQGNIKQEFIQLSLTDPSNYKYFVKREQLDGVINAIKMDERNILVHSDLGNGKTIFLNGLAYLLKAAGHTVFIFHKEYDNVENEIENICKSEVKPVIIIESYGNHLNLIDSLSLHRTNDVTVILSERTLINDTIYSKIEDGIFNGVYLTVDLNKLTNLEVDAISRLFEDYGFWGRFSNLSHIQKTNLIFNDCRRTLRLLLLKILNSPDIRVRFDNILVAIRDKKSFYNAIIIILASSIFDFTLDLDDLIYILDDELLNNPTFVNNTNLKEIINFDTRSINVRSSILSEAIINNLPNKKVVVDCLIKVVTKLDKRRQDYNSYIIQKNITSFSRLQRIIDQKTPEYKDTIIYFFENVKNLESNRRNPYFWLQYAIARLSIRDYTNADVYFQTAYSFADFKKGFDTYQIDNHYARYILENEIFFGDKDSCMPQFLKAHKILYNTKSGNTGRHYPIRVAKNYVPFYQHFFSNMDSSDKIIFLKCCQEILFRVEEYLKTEDIDHPKREVLDCKNELTEIININQK